MKKIISIIFTTLLMINTSAFAYNFFTSNEYEKEIRQTVKNYSKAMQKHDIEKIKTFYHNEYLSTDGFNIDDLENMLKKTYSSYENLKYKIKINSVKASENCAIVQLSDKTKAIVYSDDEKTKEKAGKLQGESSWTLFLKKENDEWKIIKEDILTEETSLKYGLAQKIKIHLNTPMFIKNGEEYNISLKIDKPKNIVALASIANEEITYPPKDYDDRFRKIPEHGDLERLVKANNKGINEYSLASIGLSKISINEEETKAKIEIIGIAYIMKRVNLEKNQTFLVKGKEK